MAKSTDVALHLGADLQSEFVHRFRSYCQDANFNQSVIIQRVLEWWLEQSDEVQYQIYRGRFNRVKLATQPAEPESEIETQKRILECLDEIRALLQTSPKTKASKKRRPG